MVAGRAGPLSGHHEGWCRHNVSRPLSSWAPTPSHPPVPVSSSSSTPPHQLLPHTSSPSPHRHHTNLDSNPNPTCTSTPRRHFAPREPLRSAGYSSSLCSALLVKRASRTTAGPTPAHCSSTPLRRQRATPRSSSASHRAPRTDNLRRLLSHGLLCRTSLSPPVRRSPRPWVI